MRKFVLITIITLISCAASEASIAVLQKSSYPKQHNDEKLEKSGGAYKKALGQAVNERSIDPVCYYTMSGCSEEQKAKDANFNSAGRPPLQYPKQGYLLGVDGLYHFNPSAMSGN